MSGPPLTDEAIVIRGGILELERTREVIDLCFFRAGFYGLSLMGEDGCSLREIAMAARLRNRLIRVSRVGRLRALGHEPFRSGRRPHLSLRFAYRPSDSDLELLDAAFDPPVPNPHVRT